MSVSSWIRPLVVAAIMSTMLGCGVDGPELADVEGTVRLGGQPLEGATVLFTPTAGGRPSGGLTDDDGRFELNYTQNRTGALPGEHVVTISTYRKGDPDSDRERVPERVPANYNVRTELKRTVEAAHNAIEFDLVAQGKIIEPRE